jgi:threonylcarbamoyladenosine tRNA methylthiotransferase MtaB
MKRKYLVKDFLKIVNSLKNRYPDFNLTTDVIVGFPGEDENDFRETCKIVEEVGFSHIHTFKYSKRNNTLAAKMDGQTDEKVKTARSQKMRDLSGKNKLNYRKSFLGKEQTLLTEKCENGIWSGYGEHYLPIKIKNKNLKKNQFCKTILRSVSDSKDYIFNADVKK